MTTEWLRRLDSCGASALEFALTAPIFIGLLVAFFDVGIYFLNKNVMMSALSVAQRTVQTGEIQAVSPNMRERHIQDMVCGETILSACDKRLSVDLRRLDGTVLKDGEGYTPRIDDYRFDAGSGGTLMGLELSYRLPTLFSGPVFEHAGTSDDSILQVRSIFRTEPFQP
ncbi:MAG: pilus assembly protein [Geminicoccaceae bacterium]|nr:pilus assembly protein [Geminicoccaceae bacterium]